MITSFKAALGKSVAISANGIVYRGILKAITEDEVFIKGPSKTWGIPLSTVRSISAANAGTMAWNNKRSIITPKEIEPVFDIKTDPYGTNKKRD
ncbi:MAG: hypothetical protein JWQ35_2446 [Bacteriovoracaceae bacterium]|nr:hypothetical protein [Bacteriovoracaceae bacterium]